MSLVAAYLGHVAYGYPLGKMAQNFDTSIANLKFFKKGLVTASILISVGVLVIILTFRVRSNVDSTLVFSDQAITPNIIRINSGNSIQIRNERNWK